MQQEEQQLEEITDESIPLFLTVHGTPIYFRQDWGAGIGGGLWSTGSALAAYFQTDHAREQVTQLLFRHHKKKLDVLELGSGNGLLACCFGAMASPHIRNFVVTDTDDHLDMIRQIVRANRHIFRVDQSSSAQKAGSLSDPIHVHVMEHVWGAFKESSRVASEDSDKDDAAHAVQCGTRTFDLILGSDVAYREHLYSPLIASLVHFSNAHTVSLIGVTMHDTTPAFFDLLDAAGFCYERLADHLLPAEFRGTTFGIFVLQKKGIHLS